MSMAWLQHCHSRSSAASPPLSRRGPAPSVPPGTGDNRNSKCKGFDDASSLSPHPKFSCCSPGWQRARGHRDPGSTCHHTPLVPEGLLRPKRSPLTRHVPCPCFSTTSSRPGLRSNCDAAEAPVTVPRERCATLASGRERESPALCGAPTQLLLTRSGVSSLSHMGGVSGRRLSAPLRKAGRLLPSPCRCPVWPGSPGLWLRSCRRPCRAWRLDRCALVACVPGDRHHLCPKDGRAVAPTQGTRDRPRVCCVPRWSPDGLLPPGSGGQMVCGERLDFYLNRDKDLGHILPSSVFAPIPLADSHGHLPFGDVTDPVCPHLSRDSSGQ